MRLFLKHIFRSIGKKPLQPIVIVLTLAMAMATAVFSFTIADAMEEELNVSQAEKYGHAKFTVGLGNSSDSRFLFADDVVDVIGEDALVVGCYELPLILTGTGNTTVAVATEFARVGNLFHIEFAEFGKVTEGSVGDVAFISSDFAQEHQLAIGDTLAVEVMGYSKTYRIEGISKRAFMASCDVMVDISGLTRAFASNSLLFAAIGEDFKPCNKVYVNTDDVQQLSNISEAILYLKQDSRFADKVFEELYHAERRQINFPVLELIIKFAVALAALLSGVVVFCCFYILANERAEENQTFTYSGAGPRMLVLMQYAEVMLYWGLGAVLGWVVAIPASRLVSHFVDLQYTTASIKAGSVLKSAFILLGVCILTTALFMLLHHRMKRAGVKHVTIPTKWILWLVLVIGVLFSIMYLLPENLRLAAFAFSIAAIVALTFCVVPLFAQRISKFVEKRMHGAQKPATASLKYAFKNIYSLKFLHNIAWLCALIVMIVLTVGLVFLDVQVQIENFSQMFCADYAVLNATDSCYQKTQTCQSVKSVHRAYMMQTDWGLIVSADDPSVYADWMQIDTLPTGNEATVSIGLAHAHSLKIGDTFEMEWDGEKYEFVISQITYSPTSYFAINCEDLNVPYNMLLVQGNAGVSSAELLGDLSQTTASELAPIAQMDSLLARFVNAVKMYMDAGRLLLLIFIIFSLIGMADVFYESLRARREEFGLYLLAGMKRRELQLMKIFELAVTVLLGLVIGLGAFIFAAVAVNMGMSARGMEVFIGVLSFLQ